MNNLTIIKYASFTFFLTLISTVIHRMVRNIWLIIFTNLKLSIINYLWTFNGWGGVSKINGYLFRILIFHLIHCFLWPDHINGFSCWNFPIRKSEFPNGLSIIGMYLIFYETVPIWKIWRLDVPLFKDFLHNVADCECVI